MSLKRNSRYKENILARLQLYMAKLVSRQVGKGESAEAKEIMLDTYVICIGEENLFKDNNICQAQKEALHQEEFKHSSYMSVITPMIHNLYITVEDNKMTWKIFELNKFKKYMNEYLVDKDSSLIEQWLKFLVDCPKMEDKPEDIAEVVKVAYDIMEMANWSRYQHNIYELSVKAEVAIEAEKKAFAKRERAEGRIEGEEIGIKKGRIEGIKEEKIKNIEKEISIYIDLSKMGLTPDIIHQAMSLTHEENEIFARSLSGDRESIVEDILTLRMSGIELTGNFNIDTDSE